MINIRVWSLPTLVMLTTMNTSTANEPDRIEITRVLAVPVGTAWESWTTTQGITSFFAPAARIKPAVDGEYSVLFFPDSPAGARGAENMRVVAIEPGKRLLVTWNSPAFFGDISIQRSLVEVRFNRLNEDKTELTLSQFGWGRGEQWSEIRQYFASAWEIVLDRLEYSYQNGPIDWSHVPQDLWYDSGPPSVSGS